MRLIQVKKALLSMQRYSWEQGVAMQAFFEAGDKDVVLTLAKEAAYRSLEDGRAAVIGTKDAVTDSCSVGEAMLWAAEYTKDQELQESVRSLLEWALVKAPRNKQGIVYHLMDRHEFWADSMFMLPPFLAAAGYYEEAVNNLDGYWESLFDTKAGLLCHKWDDDGKKYTRDAHWGVGNGWALAGMARVIGILPGRMAEARERLIGREMLVIENIFRYQRDDGLFHDIIDEPGTFVETNLAQMLGYTIYKGLIDKWMEPKWREKADGLRLAAESKVDDFGFVRGVCGAPSFDKPGIAPEGNAFYILMESAANNF